MVSKGVKVVITGMISDNSQELCYMVLTPSVLIRSFVFNMKRPSVKQSIKQQVSSNLADKPSLADGTPYY